MLMSQTQHAQCKQRDLSAQICLPSYTYHSVVNCFDVDFIAVTRCNIPCVVFVVIRRICLCWWWRERVFRWNYENWCWIKQQECKICFTNWITGIKLVFTFDAVAFSPHFACIRIVLFRQIKIQSWDKATIAVNCVLHCHCELRNVLRINEHIVIRINKYSAYLQNR